jgi:hypothetical protein
VLAKSSREEEERGVVVDGYHMSAFETDTCRHVHMYRTVDRAAPYNWDCRKLGLGFDS